MMAAMVSAFRAAGPTGICSALPAARSRLRRGGLAAAVFLALLAASCARPTGLILMDPALPVIDPEAAKAYAGFRAGPARRMVREYPGPDSGSPLEELSGLGPFEFILLTPLLTPEYPIIREAFPEARILGSGLPREYRSISASWDPGPSSREAGLRAAAFLRERGEDLSEPPEAVLVSSPDSLDGKAAAAAFREGLLSARPETLVRILSLPSGAEAGALEALVRNLEGPGAKAVFLDADSAGFRASRALASSRRAGGNAPGRRLVIVRSEFPSVPEDTGADILLYRDTPRFLAALGAALKSGLAGPVVVPEALTILRKPRD